MLYKDTIAPTYEFPLCGRVDQLPRQETLHEQGGNDKAQGVLHVRQASGVPLLGSILSKKETILVWFYLTEEM